VRQGERLESSGNDVANTAVALTALLRAGHGPQTRADRDVFERGLGFILARVEQSPSEGLALTNVTGTQIQRKLGPYIDTFLTSKLLGELDGNMGDAAANARRAGAASARKVRGEDREQPAERRKLECFGRVGADSRDLARVAEPADRKGQGRARAADGAGAGG
jgi:hypothetical protein